MKKILLHLCCTLLYGHMEIALGAEQQTPVAAQSTPTVAQSTPTAAQSTPMADRPTPIILSDSNFVSNAGLIELNNALGGKSSHFKIITCSRKFKIPQIEEDLLYYVSHCLYTLCSSEAFIDVPLYENFPWYKKAAKFRADNPKIVDMAALVTFNEFFLGCNLSKEVCHAMTYGTNGTYYGLQQISKLYCPRAVFYQSFSYVEPFNKQDAEHRRILDLYNDMVGGGIEHFYDDVSDITKKVIPKLSPTLREMLPLTVSKKRMFYNIACNLIRDDNKKYTNFVKACERFGISEAEVSSEGIFVKLDEQAKTELNQAINLFIDLSQKLLDNYKPLNLEQALYFVKYFKGGLFDEDSNFKTEQVFVPVKLNEATSITRNKLQGIHKGEEIIEQEKFTYCYENKAIGMLKSGELKGHIYAFGDEKAVLLKSSDGVKGVQDVLSKHVDHLICFDLCGRNLSKSVADVVILSSNFINPAKNTELTSRLPTSPPGFDKIIVHADPKVPTAGIFKIITVEGSPVIVKYIPTLELTIPGRSRDEVTIRLYELILAKTKIE